MDDNYRVKLAGLDHATRLYQNGFSPLNMTDDNAANVIAAVLGAASRFAEWLGNPVNKLVIQPDSSTEYQDNPDEVTITVFKGGHVELKDNQQVSLTVEAKDAKGFDTNEAGDVVLTWDSSDSTVVEVRPAADGLSCLAVAGNPGSALVSVTDGSVSGSLAFDVVAGNAVSLSVSAGTPEDQGSAAPAPEPPPAP